MKSKSILRQFSSVTILLLILFQISSCSHFNHQSFHKQKYLHGKLKPVYTEESAKLSDPIKSDSAQLIQEPFLAEHKESYIDEPNHNVFIQESLSSDARTEIAINEEKKTELNRSLPIIKKVSSVLPIELNKRTSSGSQNAAITWIIILVILGLIALPFAFLIGFWAFIIAAVLLTAALIIGVTTDPFVSGGGFLENLFGSLAMLIILITLIVLIAIAMAIALVWFIIWGIIQLIN